MNDRLLARQRILLVEENTLLFVQYVPAPGTVAVVVAGYAFHGQGAPLNCNFAMMDAGVETPLSSVAVLGSGTYLQLYTAVPCAKPLIIRGDGQALRFNTPLKTITKLASLVLVIDEYLGETAYGH